MTLAMGMGSWKDGAALLTAGTGLMFDCIRRAGFCSWPGSEAWILAFLPNPGHGMAGCGVPPGKIVDK